jgi:hypothetical protein
MNPERKKQPCTQDQPSATIQRQLAKIAQECLFIETLDTQNSDSLDFHDVAVWSVQQALYAAYLAGKSAK